MPWCPECGVEYISGIAVCSDCNVALVNTPPKTKEEPHSESNMVSVIKLDNSVEGAVLKGVLEEQGINSFIRDFIVSQYQLPEAGMNFWGELLVLKDDFENAKFIINEYLNSLDTGIQNEDGSEDEESSGDSDDSIQP